MNWHQVEKIELFLPLYWSNQLRLSILVFHIVQKAKNLEVFGLRYLLNSTSDLLYAYKEILVFFCPDYQSHLPSKEFHPKLIEISYLGQDYTRCILWISRQNLVAQYFDHDHWLFQTEQYNELLHQCKCLNWVIFNLFKHFFNYYIRWSN